MSRILNHLKREFPGRDWKCERNGFGWRYVTSEGWYCEFRSALVSTHPDDMDGHCKSELWLYKPNQPAEHIHGFDGLVRAIL